MKKKQCGLGVVVHGMTSSLAICSPLNGYEVDPILHLELMLSDVSSIPKIVRAKVNRKQKLMRGFQVVAQVSIAFQYPGRWSD
ncbi:MAG: hypothetical protein P1V20_10805 [Verrucomicrobiales bacterium]|nr:hypothetical protein [Verrucomicrobiales bacterium]